MSESIWDSHPVNTLWNDQQNWVDAAQPKAAAVFGHSVTTGITFTVGEQAQVGQIEFEAQASAYTFHFETSEQPLLTLTGAGVVNQSQQQQVFVVAATAESNKTVQLQFTGSASAGNETVKYIAGPMSEAHYGGGVINFADQADAGSADFTVWTGKEATPSWVAQHQPTSTASAAKGDDTAVKKSTVGGEVSFSDKASANQANFTVYGSLGRDGDTFGNVVFHDTATASQATFTNAGGTVSGGDGGNTQFYGTATAANGVFYNKGAVTAKANGGDVAFDTQSTAANGTFHNYAAPASEGYGGVTSFNNNWPDVTNGGANAGQSFLYNYGASRGQQGGGGHVEFSSRYGSPSAANATITNYGSDINTATSCAGHTIFSLTVSDKNSYYPSADKAVINNHGALAKDGVAGFTEFAMYSDSESTTQNTANTAQVPTAGHATIVNYGSMVEGGAGGYVSFSNTTTAGQATLVAYSGENGGYGGKIAFYDDSTAAQATVKLYGTGSLDIAYHNGSLTLASLYMWGGTLVLKPAAQALVVTDDLYLHGEQCSFYLYAEKAEVEGQSFTVLTSDRLQDYSKDDFTANTIGGIEPTFSIEGNALKVSY